MYTSDRCNQLRVLLAGIGVVLMSACTGSTVAVGDESKVPRPQLENVGYSDSGYKVRRHLENLREPWGIDFLPDGSLLLTEKHGRLLHYDPAKGSSREVAGLPEIANAGQGGLMDILVANGTQGIWVYLSYAIAGHGGYTTRVARARFDSGALVDLDVLFTAEPYFSQRRHFGSRLLLVDDYLFITVGDRGNRKLAQRLDSHNGKVMRIHADGRIPSDNPFVGKGNALPEIYSYGHRNPQGLARHPVDGGLWISEHGPQGGDELNLITRGSNYGWPRVTFGEEYGGGKIGEGTHLPGMTMPRYHFVPSVGTAGMAFYTGSALPRLRDTLLLGALRSRGLLRMPLDDFSVSGRNIVERHRGPNELSDLGMRIRDVQVGPRGHIWLLADGDKLLELAPSR